MTVYIANTNFEFELAQPTTLSLQESWRKRPHCLQLQFIPLLFAESTDTVAVLHYPIKSTSMIWHNYLANRSHPLS